MICGKHRPEFQAGWTNMLSTNRRNRLPALTWTARYPVTSLQILLRHCSPGDAFPVLDDPLASTPHRSTYIRLWCALQIRIGRRLAHHEGFPACGPTSARPHPKGHAVAPDFKNKMGEKNHPGWDCSAVPPSRKPPSYSISHFIQSAPRLKFPPVFLTGFFLFHKTPFFAFEKFFHLSLSFIFFF